MLIVYCLKVEDAERFLTSAERQAVLLHLLYSLKGSGQPPVLATWDIQLLVLSTRT